MYAPFSKAVAADGVARWDMQSKGEQPPAVSLSLQMTYLSRISICNSLLSDSTSYWIGNICSILELGNRYNSQFVRMAQWYGIIMSPSICP